MDIHGILEVARGVKDLPDARPEWLEKLRDTDHDQAMYYRFLHDLSRTMKPKWIVETGTRFGLSAAQLAMGSPESKVITIDIDPLGKAKFAGDATLRKITNVIALTGDSRQVRRQLPAECAEVGILYLDSDHSYDVVKAEFSLYLDLVAKGGVVVFDDIHLNEQMRRFWAEVPEPKVELNHLHRLSGAGFGVYVKEGAP